MSKKQERVALTEAQLAAKIDRLVELRPMANEYRSLCDDVKKELIARGNGFETPAGNKGKVLIKPRFEWLLEKVEAALSRNVFYALCPRKPDAKKLNQRLAATPEDKRLAAARVEINPTLELEVLAAGETEVAAPSEYESEAA